MKGKIALFLFFFMTAATLLGSTAAISVQRPVLYFSDVADDTTFVLNGGNGFVSTFPSVFEFEYFLDNKLVVRAAFSTDFDDETNISGGVKYYIISNETLGFWGGGKLGLVKLYDWKVKLGMSVDVGCEFYLGRSFAAGVYYAVGYLDDYTDLFMHTGLSFTAFFNPPFE